ncbi:MAG: signal peptidase I [Alphaproteobacteria bacterium]
MANRSQPTSSESAASWLGEWIRTILWAVGIAVVIRSLMFQPFNIPSSSMVPTLLVGDFLFVTKFSYGYSKHSFPFSPPVLNGRIMGDEPDRGDVAVFKTPQDNRTDFIKRVVGLPGDRVQMISGALYINGEAIKRERVEDFLQRDAGGNVRRARQYRETMPNGVTYMTLDLFDNGHSDDTGVFVVPEGHYFMMGDNRDNSQDSRVPGAVGFVPAENLVGKAQVLWLSTKDGAPFWQVWNWRFDRFFDKVS